MPEIARKFVAWKGRKIPLVRDNGGLWRLRSRSKFLNVDVSTGTTNETAARQVAKRLLEDGVATESPRRGPASATLQTLVDVYMATPKKVARVSAASNVNRLAAIVRAVHGKELDQVKVKDANAELWQQYQAGRYAALGRPFDYTQRIPENAGINAAVRAARSIFIRRLRPAYERAGLHIPEDSDNVTWLPEPVLVRPPADDAGLVAAWLAADRDALWFVIGLARFAGLRLAEIAAMRREWVSETAGVVAVELRDRPTEGFQHKTGKPYSAPVLHPVLATALIACPPGLVVNPPVPARWKWLDTVPQQWARQFVGTEVRKPVHRLRGLYASDLAERTRAAVAAQLAGEQAAAAALGHTTPETTRRHYL
jgi:integrase